MPPEIKWDYPDAHSYSIYCRDCKWTSWAPTHTLAEEKVKVHNCADYKNSDRETGQNKEGESKPNGIRE